MDRKLKILHLEDLPEDAEFVDRQLKKSNVDFDKIVVDTREEFIKAITDFSPDIVLSDHSLPSFNSLEALKILRQQGLSIPFILVTATVSEEFAVSVMKEGATDYILKDRLQRLPNAVINAVEKYRLANEKKKIIEDIIVNETLMKEAEHLAGFGSWQYNNETKTMIFSDEMYRILCYEQNEIIPSRFSFLQKVHPEDQQLLMKTLENIYADRQQTTELTFRIIDKNNSIKIIRSEVVVLKKDNGNIYKINGFCQDITDIKQKEQKLAKYSADLRELAQHLQNIREEERASIAREIHDALGQELTALKIDLAWLIKKLEDPSPAIITQVERMMELLNSTIVSVRRIATQLRPSILDDLGLRDALIWQSGEFERRTNIEVNFVSDSFLPEIKNYGIAIFRIYQESLTNIARHAEASIIDAALTYENSTLFLTISDNGKGFDIDEIKNKKTLGLLGMKERVMALEGNFELDSSPGKGTKITISLPYHG